MNINIIIPNLPESISEALIVKWNKKIGEIVQKGDILLEIETDKVILEIPSPNNGTLKKILIQSGKFVKSDQVVGYLENHNNKKTKNKNIMKIANNPPKEKKFIYCTPSFRRYIDNKKKDINEIINQNVISKTTENAVFSKNVKENKKKDNNILKNKNFYEEKKIKIVPMNNLRKKIADRLLYSKNNTAMLTTFNEVNMKNIIEIRNKYNKQNNIHLGFISFFLKATVKSLKMYPIINASIKDNNIIYYKTFDINIAISTNRGLVTPVLYDVDKINILEIEKKIKELKDKGENGKLKIQELIGGSFTITNGGVFGSLFSTPIINPPQSAILAIHKIKDRPMAIKNKIVILPMMYIALSYDHRLIDGNESISFLNEIKKILEDPFKLLIHL